MATPDDAAASSQDPGARALRILVVDDDELDRLAVRRGLLQSGIAATIEEASTAAEAVARAQAGAYHCVILDYYLPGVDNVSLLRQIQAVAGDIPIVILTGRGDEEIAVEFMKAGALDYLPKASMTAERLAASCRYAIEIARAAAARRDIEQSLREREAEFRTLANVIPQMAWMADSEGRRYWYNDRWHEFTGLRPDESFGLGWRLVHHPDHRARVTEGLAAAFARGAAWEDTFPLRRKDGVYRWFLARAVPFRTAADGAARWFGTDTDITERLEAERALGASEGRLRALIESSPLGIDVMDLDGRPTFFNPKCEELHGMTLEQAAGNGWTNAIHPEDRQRVAASWHAAAAAAAPWHETYRFRHPDGRVVWVSGRAAPMRVGGEPVGFVGTLEDITEERDALAAAERASRARDEVLAIVAHDLRNPVHTIVAATSMLALTAEEEKRRRQIGIITRAAKEMERLMSNILDVTRIEAGTFALRRVPVDVRTLITEMLDQFEPQAQARRISLNQQCAPDVHTVAADRERLVQVFSNLLGNALKFTAEGSVSVRAVMEGSTVLVSVEDSGSGIPEENLPFIFDRFWQATRTGRVGAGLGLAICKGIVDAHGGRIWASSKVGHGTTVHFTLPNTIEEPPGAGGAATAKVPAAD